MKFRSTLRRSPEVSLRDAILQGSAPDGGLYMPVEMPRLAGDFLARLPSLSFLEIAQEVGALFTGKEIPPPVLQDIVTTAFDFPVPLVALGERLHILELFHGPTLAFKDFGARFMARLMGYFVAESGKQLTVIVATSGDTGSAVAQAFLGVPGIRVVILYPAGRVSSAQEKQLTTLGQNITALEVAGSFDDCQRLAKQALVDPVLDGKAHADLSKLDQYRAPDPADFLLFRGSIRSFAARKRRVVFSVPSGNFGNLTGGLFAKRIGLPVAQFIAATNTNDVVPEFLRSGNLIPRASRHTLSNAMDVGNPSNFARIVDLYDNDLRAIRHDIWGCSFSDEETLRVMHDVELKYGYVLDPHTAIGVLGWQSLRETESRRQCRGLSWPRRIPPSSARPSPAPSACGRKCRNAWPRSWTRQKKSIPFPNRFAELQEFLLSSDT